MKYIILKDQSQVYVIFMVISNYISFIEIKKLIRTYLALIANKYPKIKEPILPDQEPSDGLLARLPKM